MVRPLAQSAIPCPAAPLADGSRPAGSEGCPPGGTVGPCSTAVSALSYWEMIMALGLAPATANAILDALCRSVTWTEPDALWVKLHVGDPGAAGTANAATETTRKQATFGSAASGGSIANTSALSWTSVAGTEDYTHFSAWDASTGGNFIYSGTVTANPMTAGDDLNIAIGALVVALAVAA